MKRAVTVACLAAGLAAPAAAQTSHAPKPAEQCFRSRDYQGFRPLSDKAFVVRANSGRYYQIEVASGCPELKAPNARLITMQHGLDRVCGPLDWDLRVSQGAGDVAVGCIVTGQRRLTAAEVAALPRRARP